MAAIRNTLAPSEQQDAQVKARIKSAGYTNDSEQNAKLIALRQAIQEGLDSGVSNRTMDEAWAEAERRHRRKRRNVQITTRSSGR